MKSFDEVWKAMEIRQQQCVAGALPRSHARSLARQALRHDQGCPTDETLCGFADGQLLKTRLWLWVKVWWHVVLNRCAYCREDMAALQEEGVTASYWVAWCVWRRPQRRPAWRPLSVCACALAMALLLVSGWHWWLRMGTTLQPEVHAMEVHPQARSEGMLKPREWWRFWQVLQDSYKDILPSGSEQEDFLNLRRLTALQYALRDYDAVIATATQALSLHTDRLMYRYRSAAYDAKGQRAQALHDIRHAAKLGDEEAQRRLWAIGER